MTFSIFIWLILVLLALSALGGAFLPETWNRRSSFGTALLLIVLLTAICWRLWPWR